MKQFLFLLATMVTLAFASCKKDIATCEPVNPACTDTVPQNQLCQAFFTRWFYNKETNTCNEISYSGCSPKGFATKAECEACKCK